MIRALLKYNYKSFLRLKMSPFIAPPDFLAILLSLLFLSVVTVGLSFDNPIIFFNKRIINFNYVIILNYLIALFFEGYIFNYYTPNYKYLKLLFPYKIKRIIVIDLLLEIFSFKFLLLVFFFMSYLGFIFFILSYINSCFLVCIIKCIKRINVLNQNKNLFKTIFFLLIAMAIINDNYKLIKFDEISTLFILGMIIFFLNILFLFFLYRINVFYDKIK